MDLFLFLKILLLIIGPIISVKDLNISFKEQNCPNEVCLGNCGDDSIRHCPGCSYYGCGLTPGDRSVYHCSCDVDCMIYDDCCKDFFDVCPLLAESAFGSYIENIDKSYLHECISVPFRLVSLDFKMISICQGNPCNLSSPIHPVTDRDSGLHYASLNCSICNGVTNATSWTLNFACSTESNLTNSGYDDLVKGLEENQCELYYDVPNSARQCFSTIKACSLSPCVNIQYAAKCCNSCTNYSIEHLSIFQICDNPTFFPTNQENPSISSLHISFDFSYIKDIGKTSNLQTKIFCKSGSILQNENCLDIDCENEQQMASNLCSNILESCMDFTYWFVSRSNRSFSLNNLTDMLGKEKLIDTLGDEIQIKTKTISCKVLMDHMIMNINCNYCYSAFEVKLNNNSKALDNVNNDMIHDEIFERLKASCYQFFLYEDMFIFFLNSTFSIIDVNENDLQLHKFDCALVKIEDYSISNNGSLESFSLQESLPFGDYLLIDDVAYVCLDVYKKFHYVWYGHSSYEMGLTSTTVMSFSVVSLFLRLILQPFIPHYKSFPNKLQFCLCLSMFICYFLLLIAPYLEDYNVVCYIVAAASHWSVLSVFTWMTLVTRNLYKNIKPKIIHNYSNKHLLYYVLFGWGFPFLVTLICLFLDWFENIPPLFKTMYGYPTCWINNNYAHLLYFGIPFFLFMTANVIQFVILVIRMCTTYNDTSIVHDNALLTVMKLNFKLSVLCGISWILAVIASILQLKIMWYAFVVLCGLQGVFIAVCFLFTQKVWGNIQLHITTDVTTEDR